MSVFNQIARNSIINITGKIASLILGLVAVAIMTRYLGQDGFGYYTTVIAFLQFFGIMADFGLTLTTVQMISKPNTDLSRTMNSIVSFRVITAAACLLLAPIVCWFFPYNIFIKLGVSITAASFFCITVINVLTGVFQQKLKMLRVTIAEVVGRIVLVGLVGITVWLHKDIYWIFGAISAGSIVNLLIVWISSGEFVKWKWEIDWSIWKELCIRSWPIALSISFNLIYLKMDTIILSLTRTQAEVGLYGASYRVVDILTMLPAVFMGIVLPQLTIYFQENQKEELVGLLQKSFDALMIFAVPIIVGTMIIGRQVMSFVAGKEFILSGDILKVLILASGAIFLTTLFGYGVIAVEKQRKIMWAYLVTAVITLAGYLIFIPQYGYWAAGWWTVFSETVVAVWSAVLLYKTIKFFPSLRIIVKSLAAALVMAAVLYATRNQQVLIALFAGIIVYFVFLYLFGGIKRESLVELLKLK